LIDVPVITGKARVAPPNIKLVLTSRYREITCRAFTRSFLTPPRVTPFEIPAIYTRIDFEILTSRPDNDYVISSLIITATDRQGSSDQNRYDFGELKFRCSTRTRIYFYVYL